MAKSERDLLADEMTALSNSTNKIIFDLIQSTDLYDKLAGITAIGTQFDIALIPDSLISCAGEELSTKVTRFANYLRAVLPGTDPLISITASKALGRLALLGGMLTNEFVEFEIKRSLEWLQSEKQDMKRFAAIHVIKELITAVPALTFTFMNPILEAIWLPIKDTKIVIRELAAETLIVCLDSIEQRDDTLRKTWNRKLYDESCRCLKSSTPDTIHGSLLVIRALFAGKGKFMDQQYREVYDMIYKIRENKDVTIRKSVVQLIPDLAFYDTQIFVSEFLTSSMTFLLGQLRKEKDRGYAFIAVGEIAKAVGKDISPFLENIFQIIKEAFIQKQ